MDIQAGYRTFDIELSDGSSIEVEVGFKFSTGDDDLIANTQLENLLLTDVLTPMQSVVLALLSESDAAEDDETEDDAIDADLEEAE